jgi:hypothetical protein
MKKLIWALALCLSFASFAQADLINEMSPNPPGTETGADMFFELSGTAGASTTGFIVAIEAEGAGIGVVQDVISYSGTFDSNGLLVVSGTDIENPSFTIVVTDTFSGTDDVSDVDTDNDGVIDDTSFFGTIMDAIGVPDSVADESFIYGSQLGGADFGHTGDEPQYIFREQNTGDWYAVNDPANGVYDITGTEVFENWSVDPEAANTRGALNPFITAIPEPTSAMIFGLAGLGLCVVRRR